MVTDTRLGKLRHARLRAHLALKQAEARSPSIKPKLADLEARMQAIAPDLELTVRFRERNPVFARGQLPRLALGIMREEWEAIARRRHHALYVGGQGCDGAGLAPVHAEEEPAAQ